MEKKEQHALLLQIYSELQEAGIIRTQGDFAQLLGMSRNYVSKAMNGRDEALNPRFMAKVVQLRKRVLDGETPAVPSHGPVESAERADGIFIPRETLTLYESLARTAENLTAIVSRLMPGGVPTVQVKKDGTSPE